MLSESPALVVRHCASSYDSKFDHYIPGSDSRCSILENKRHV